MHRENWRSSLAWLLVGLVAVAFLGGLAYYRPFQPKSNEGEMAESLPLPAKPPGKRTTFLVMGVDKRGDDVGRSDSMMVLSYDQEAQQLAILSLPRDTWVQIPGNGYDKVNHAYAFGGDKLAVSAVSRFLGLPIDHAVTVNFQGFARLVDALGGIEVNAEKRMVYRDPFDTSMGPEGLVIDIQPGLQRMDGITALKYSRFRYDEEGDVGRMRRQQQVVKAMVAAANRPGVVTRLPQLVPALMNTVSTDMNLAEMISMVSGVREALARPLRTVTLSGTPKEIGGVFYFVPDIEAVRVEAYQALVGGYPPEPFLAQAREEQNQYVKALAETVALDEQAKAAVALQPKSGTARQKVDEPSLPKAGPDLQPPDPGKTGQASTQEQPKSPPITVAVMDGSGRNLYLAYAVRLKAAGFQIGQVTTLPERVPQTFAVDHTGRADTGDRIHAVLPGIVIRLEPGSKTDNTVTITLGTDVP
ncbi:MAG: LCP family protein [Mycobacterium leprae]